MAQTAYTLVPINSVNTASVATKSKVEIGFPMRPLEVPLGVTYHPATCWSDFALDVRPEVAQVDVVVRRSGASPNGYEYITIPMQNSGNGYGNWEGIAQAPARWVISVKGLEPGDHYSYTLKDSRGDILAQEVSDPFALASTQLVWKADYIERVRRVLEGLRKPGEDNDALLRRIYSERSSDASGDPHAALGITANDFDHPWSIVIDQSRLLDSKSVDIPQPHGAGQRRICKFHPLMSLGLADRHFNPEMAQYKGKVEFFSRENRRFFDYLRGIGVNTIEFFPLNACVSDPAELALGYSGQGWGYNPQNPIGLGQSLFHTQDPHERIRKMQEIVLGLKQEGFSVIADVVSGHTAEFKANGLHIKPDTILSYSLRCLDPKNYLLHDGDGREIDVTGCGNTINARSLSGQALLRALFGFYASLGMEVRIDQAPTLAYRPDQEGGFEPEDPFFSEMTSVTKAPIGELMHAKGHYDRHINKNITSWSYSLRNLQYALVFNERSMWPDSNPVAYRAFIASGSCGGLHPLQQRHPADRNAWVQVHSHDGETVYDRGRWAAAIRLAESLEGDDELRLLIDKVRNTPSNYDALYREGQPRYAAMVEIVAYLSDKYPGLLKQEQERAARWFLAQLFTTPGDILMVAGDHAYRTQDNNANAYNKPEYLLNALSSSPNRSEGAVVTPLFDTGKVLLQSLANLRERYPFVFSNTSIVDGNNNSSVDAGIIPSFSWHTAAGEEMASRDWEYSNPDDFFLGWQISARPAQHYSLHSRLYLADSNKARSIVLPDAGANREWVELVNSGNPNERNRRFQSGENYKFEGCGMVVLESALRNG
jgi:hypothetical protein